ncbi:RM17 protein, partial [Heliornis fulica]|nr:RM17 protein [Heliornis fulica]
MRLSAASLISHGRVNRLLGLGPRSRLDLLRNLVTALVRHERIEAPWARADEMQGYAERAHSGNYTRLLQIPNQDSLDRAKMAVIELKGNPLPPLIRTHRDTEKTLINQLLKGYREDMEQAAAP